MSDLFVLYDREKKTLTFSGPGTFYAKDIIKTLGSSKWQAASKSWEVSFNGELEEVRKLLPRAIFSNLEEKIEPLPQESKNSTVVPGGSSVSEFIFQVKHFLEQAFPKKICIYGVISAVKYYNNRAFIDLADAQKPDTKISCIIWQQVEKITSELTKAGFKLEQNLQVMFEGSINVSPKDGRLNVVVTRIVTEYTLGKIAAQREQTNQKLKEEKLFDKNKQTVLPFLPIKLGILTSAGGTVINDFLASLNVAEFGFQLEWIRVSVQGMEAKREILSGLEQLIARKPDAILLFRGGGSQADLSVFNDYELAKAICCCPLPVISAIGHQEDQSSVQDVSYLALGVPKDIGRFFADIILTFREKVTHAGVMTKTIAGGMLSESFSKLQSLLVMLERFPAKEIEARYRAVEGVIAKMEARSQAVVAKCEAALFSKMQGAHFEVDKKIKQHIHEVQRMSFITREALFCIAHSEKELDKMEVVVEHSSPQLQMARGFSIVRGKEDKRIIKNAETIQPGEQLEVEFSQGKIDVEAV